MKSIGLIFQRMNREPEPEFRGLRTRRRSADYSQGQNEEDDGVLYFTDCVMFPPRFGVGKVVIVFAVLSLSEATQRRIIFNVHF